MDPQHGWLWTNGGELIGAAVTGFVLWRTLRFTRKQNTEQRRQTMLDKFNYFNMLVTNIISFAVEQWNMMTDAINGIEASPADYFPVIIKTNNNLRRLSEELDLEGYVLAYAEVRKDESGTSSEDAINEISQIIDEIDRLHAIFRNLGQEVNFLDEHASKLDNEITQQRFKYSTQPLSWWLAAEAFGDNNPMRVEIEALQKRPESKSLVDPGAASRFHDKILTPLQEIYKQYDPSRAEVVQETISLFGLYRKLIETNIALSERIATPAAEIQACLGKLSKTHLGVRMKELRDGMVKPPRRLFKRA